MPCTPGAHPSPRAGANSALHAQLPPAPSVSRAPAVLVHARNAPRIHARNAHHTTRTHPYPFPFAAYPPAPLPAPYLPHPRPTDRRWVTASPPLHAHKTYGLVPAMPFAHRVLLSSSPDSAPSSVSDPGAGGDPEPMVLGLVPCAVDGTRIWMWSRGQPLYEAAVARARAAVADGGGELGALLWFQGESDTVEVDDARSYGGKMERLVTDFRADLGLPNLLQSWWWPAGTTKAA